METVRPPRYTIAEGEWVTKSSRKEHQQQMVFFFSFQFFLCFIQSGI